MFSRLCILICLAMVQQFFFASAATGKDQCLQEGMPLPPELTIDIEEPHQSQRYIKIRRVGQDEAIDYQQSNRCLAEILPMYPMLGLTKENVAEKLRGKNILDAGTGREAAVVEELRQELGYLGKYGQPVKDPPKAKIVGLDLNNWNKRPYLVDGDMLRLADPKSPLSRHPLMAPNSYDYVFSSWSLLSYEGDKPEIVAPALFGLARVTKPGGVIAIGPVGADVSVVVHEVLARNKALDASLKILHDPINGGGYMLFERK